MADPTERTGDQIGGQDAAPRSTVTVGQAENTPFTQATPSQGTFAQDTFADGHKTSRLSQKRNQQLLAYGLIAFGAVLLLNRLGGADWLWLALLSGVFLLGYVSRKNYGFLVAGGVLMGVAVGTLIDTQSGFFLSLAAGFFVIDRIEPKPNRWALWTSAIFAVLGALGALSVSGLLSSVGFALVLIAGGAYLLLRDRQPGFPPKDMYRPTRTENGGSQNAKTLYTGETYTPTPSTTPPTGTSSSASAPTVAPTPPPATPAPQEPVATDTQPEPEPTPAPTPPPLSPEAEARLRRLEAWRRETAAAEGTPAYIVFSNDTLAKIALAEPRTLAELGAVKGVGPVKLERYGEAVLELMRDAAPAYEADPS